MTSSLLTEEPIPVVTTLSHDAKPRRSPALDIARGIAIAAVVLIHVSSHFMHLQKAGGPLWTALLIVNGACQFAVPLFLMISATLYSGKLAKLGAGEQAAYAGRKSLKSLAIYVGSALGYIVIDRLDGSGGAGFRGAAAAIWTGNVEFHLYFMLILLQLDILGPILRPLISWVRSLPVAILLCAVVQAAFYAFNRWAFPVNHIGSMLYWYIVPVMMGFWLGSQQKNGADILHRWIPVFVLASIALVAAYIPLRSMYLRGLNVDGMTFQAVEWSLTACVCLLLMAVCSLIRPSQISFSLVALGTRTLPIYLLHPLAIEALDALRATHWPIIVGIPTYLFTCVAAPLAVSWLTRAILRRK